MKSRTVLLATTLFISILLTLSFSPVSAKGVRGVTADTIKIGITTDLTGPVVTLGRPYSEGVKNYLRYVNDQGGIHNRKFKFIIADDRYNVALCIAAFKKLAYKDRVFSHFMLSQTAAIKALFDDIEKARIITFPMPQGEAMVQPIKRHIFVPVASYEDHIKVDVDYIMNDLKAKNPRIAFVSPDTEAARADLAGLMDRVKLYNLPPIRREIVAMGSIEAASQILSLKRYKPDYVILGPTGAAVGGLVLREARKYGFSPSGFLGEYSNCEDVVVDMAKKAAKNYYASHTFNAWLDDTPGMRELRKITLKYQPDTKSKIRFYVHGWTEAMLLVEGLKRTGRDLTTERLVDALESINDFRTGLTGAISFSPQNHRGGSYLRIFKADIEKVRMMPVTGWRKPVSK